MKIDFLTPFHTKNFVYKNYVQNPDNSNNTNITELSNAYYVPFKGDDTKLVEQFESLKGVHCPCCGIKMLNKNELNEILKQAETIETREDFLKILNDNYDSISNNLKSTVKFFNKVLESKPDITTTELIAMSKTGANKNIENVLNSQIEYLEECTNSDISNKDKQLLQECIDKLLEMQNSWQRGNCIPNHKEILRSTVLEMESPEKYKIYTKLKSSYGKAYEKRSVLSNLDANGKSQEYNVIANIFEHSLPHLDKINKNIESDSLYNKILLCNTCSRNKDKTIMKMVTEPDETHLKNYNLYLEDIASKVINNEIDINPNYVLQLHARMKRISKGSLHIEDAPSIHNIRKQNFLRRNKDVEFDLTEKEGIPCVGCGKDTITHKQKIQLFEQISNSSTKLELVQILKDNENIIRNRYKSIVNDFISFVEENPDITDEELIEKLKDASSKRIKKRLVKSTKYVQNIIDYKPLTIHDRKLAKEYIKTVNEKFLTNPDGEIFCWYDFDKLLNLTINEMEYKGKKFLFNNIKYNIKDAFSAEHTIYPINAVVERYNSSVKVIVQNIIKESVATKDHVIAKFKAGSDENKNIVVLCKSCNQFKGSMGFYNWLMRNKNAENYFPKYFSVISEKIKNGEIEPEYKEYLKELQMHLYEISQGKFDVEYSYDL